MAHRRGVVDERTGQVFTTLKAAGEFYGMSARQVRDRVKKGRPFPDGDQLKFLGDELDSEVEEWKSIPGFEGLYSISTKRRIRSDKFKGRLKKSTINNRDQEIVVLFKDNVRKMYCVNALFDLTWYNIPLRSSPFKKDKRQKVKCLTDGKIFDSIADCARFYHISYSAVIKVLGGKKDNYRGLKFERVGGENTCQQ